MTLARLLAFGEDRSLGIPQTTKSWTVILRLFEMIFHWWHFCNWNQLQNVRIPLPMCHGCAYRTYHFRNESLGFGHDSVYRLVTIEDSFRSNRFNPLESCLVPICGRGRSVLGCACLVCFSYFYFYDWSKSEAGYKLDFYCGIQKISPLCNVTLRHCQPCVFNQRLLKLVSKVGMCWKQWACHGNEIKSRQSLPFHQCFGLLPYYHHCVFNRLLLKFVSKVGMCPKQLTHQGNEIKSRKFWVGVKTSIFPIDSPQQVS